MGGIQYRQSRGRSLARACPPRRRAEWFPDPPSWFTATGIIDHTLESAIRRHVSFVLDYTEGELDWAAQELGVNASTLWRWRKQWERADAATSRETSERHRSLARC
jgi:hypothetical protein